MLALPMLLAAWLTLNELAGWLMLALSAPLIAFAADSGRSRYQHFVTAFAGLVLLLAVAQPASSAQAARTFIAAALIGAWFQVTSHGVGRRWMTGLLAAALVTGIAVCVYAWGNALSPKVTPLNGWLFGAIRFGPFPTPEPTDPIVWFDDPAIRISGAATVQVSGAAIDRNWLEGCGIDFVRVYADDFRDANALGIAEYGVIRPEYGAALGERFAPCGWKLVLPEGTLHERSRILVIASSSASRRVAAAALGLPAETPIPFSYGASLNTAGALLVVLFALAAVRQDHRLPRATVLVALAAIASGVLISSSRAAWIALVVVVVLALRTAHCSRRVYALALSLGVACGAVLLAATRGAIVDATDLWSRVDLWRETLTLANRDMLLGLGIGNLARVSTARASSADPHNAVLEVLVNFGIGGVVLFLVAMVKLLREGLRIRDVTPELVALFGYLALGPFESLLSVSGADTVSTALPSLLGSPVPWALAGIHDAAHSRYRELRSKTSRHPESKES